MAEQEKKKTRQELAAEVVNANASAGMTGQIQEQAKEIAGKTPPESRGKAIKTPAAFVPSKDTSDEEKALAQYKKEGGMRVGHLVQMTADVEELKKLLAGIKGVYGEGRNIADIITDMVAPEISKEEEAKIKEGIPAPDRSALDFLLGNAPAKLDKPEIDTRKEASEVIVASVMNTVASGLQTMLGSGMLPDAGAKASGEVFGAQAQRISLTEEKIREIEQKQTAIDLKHRDDIYAAMQSYDADFDETTRMFLAERNAAIARKVEGAQREYAMFQDATQFKIALTGQIQQEKQETERFNKAREQEFYGQIAARDRDAARFIHDYRQNKQITDKLAADGVMKRIGQDPMKNSLATNTYGVSLSRSNRIWSNIASKSNNPKYADDVSVALDAASIEAEKMSREAFNTSTALNLPTVEHKKLMDDITDIVETFGVIPSKEVINMLAAEPLQYLDGASKIRMSPNVEAALMKENPSLVSVSFERSPFAGTPSGAYLSDIEKRTMLQHGVFEAYDPATGESMVVQTPQHEAITAAVVQSLNAAAETKFNEEEIARKNARAGN